MLKTVRFITTHPLTADRPLAALWRFAHWQIVSRLSEEVTINWIGDAKLVARNGMTGATGNIYCGLHEFADMGLAMHLLRPDDVFVDAGANVGSYTVLASKVCGARTISIEPDPDTMKALRRNIAVNCIENLVTTSETALGATVRTVRFTIGRDSVNRVLDSEEVNGRTIAMITIDKLTQNISPIMIKIDVEGYEGEVLKGASNTLKNPSLLVVETETDDAFIASILSSYGFSRMYYDPFQRLFYDSCSSGHPGNNALYLRQLSACRDRVVNAPSRRIFGWQV